MSTISVITSSVNDNKWLIFFLLAVQKARSPEYPDLVPLVYAQQTRTNEQLCSLLSAFFFRKIPRTYMNRVMKNRVHTKQEGGITWHFGGDATFLESNSIDKPVLVVLRTKQETAHVQFLIDLATDKGWVVAEPNLSSQSALQRSFARTISFMLKRVPYHVFCDIDCTPHLWHCLSSNEMQPHGVVALSPGDAKEMCCYNITSPFLVLATEGGGNDDVAVCRTSPNLLVLHATLRVQKSTGCTNHATLLVHGYPTWIARCTVAFMEASIWCKHSCKTIPTRVVSRL